MILPFLLLFLLSAAAAFNKSAIEFFSSPENWYTALEICQAHQMQLVTLDRFQDNKDLEELREKYGPVRFWIGATDLGEDFKFVWASTGRIVDSSNWRPFEPDNYLGLESCVEVSKDGWNDSNCQNVFPFFCQKRERYLNTNAYNGNCTEAVNVEKALCAWTRGSAVRD